MIIPDPSGSACLRFSANRRACRTPVTPFTPSAKSPPTVLHHVVSRVHFYIQNCLCNLLFDLVTRNIISCTTTQLGIRYREQIFCSFNEFIDRLVMLGSIGRLPLNKICVYYTIMGDCCVWGFRIQRFYYTPDKIWIVRDRTVALRISYIATRVQFSQVTFFLVRMADYHVMNYRISSKFLSTNDYRDQIEAKENVYGRDCRSICQIGRFYSSFKKATH